MTKEEWHEFVTDYYTGKVAQVADRLYPLLGKQLCGTPNNNLWSFNDAPRWALSEWSNEKSVIKVSKDLVMTMNGTIIHPDEWEGPCEDDTLDFCYWWAE